MGDICLLYTSDAADDLLCVDLGGCRIIKKKKTHDIKKNDKASITMLAKMQPGYYTHLTLPSQLAIEIYRTPHIL